MKAKMVIVVGGTVACLDHDRATRQTTSLRQAQDSALNPTPAKAAPLRALWLALCFSETV
ncbi:MAG: hypothetical protein WBW48_10160 [Anaerolineae bacterium]